MLQNYDTFQIIRTDSDVCNLSCNLSAFAYCNTCVSCRKCRGIVNSITQHDNLASFCFLFFHEACFIFRKNLRIIFVNADLGSNSPGCTFTVSGHHNHLAESGFFQRFYNCRSFLTERILNADNSCKTAFNCKMQMGILIWKIFKLLFHAFRNGTFLILEYKMGASDDCFFPLNGCRNTMSHNVFYFGMHFLMIQFSLLRCVYNSFRHGMGKMFFQAGCNS